MSYHGFQDENSGTVVIVLFLIVALILGFAGLKCSANLDGSAQQKATEEAKVFAEQVSPGALVSCSGGDSDGDGYVSCVVVPQGDHARPPFSIQCVSAFALQASGCKLTPAITNPQGMQ